MINTAYQIVNKGSWRALSFILAVTLTVFFFFNIHQFSTALRAEPPHWVISVVWATVVLWIHGMGLDIRRTIWKILFFPYIGYVVGIIALAKNLLA